MFLLSFNFTFATLAGAEMKTFKKEYSYQASEFDSKASSRTIALEQVKRLLLEELGTYLESKTEVINLQITKDQITMLSAGIVKTEILTEKWDGKTYELVAKIVADPDEVVKSVDILRKDREKTKELEEIQKKANNALKEVEKLKRELADSKRNKETINQYDHAVRELNAADLIEQGVVLSKNGRLIGAINNFTKAIKMNPQYSWAYYHRGIAYKKISNYKQSITDFNKVIEIDPSFSWAYYHRGLAYGKIGNKKQALNDYREAAQLGDRYAQNYLQKNGIQLETVINDKYAKLILDYKSMINKDPTDMGCLIALREFKNRFYNLKRADKASHKSKYANVISKYVYECRDSDGGPGGSESCGDAATILWQSYDEISGVSKNKITRTEISYVASKNSNIFHVSDCEWAKKINQKNRIIYNSRDEAIKNQKTPCAICNP